FRSLKICLRPGARPSTYFAAQDQFACSLQRALGFDFCPHRSRETPLVNPVERGGVKRASAVRSVPPARREGQLTEPHPQTHTPSATPHVHATNTDDTARMHPWRVSSSPVSGDLPPSHHTQSSRQGAL